MKYILFLWVVSIAGSACSNDKCGSKKSGSFGSFLDDSWRTYCNEYESHVTEPLTYELLDLADFLAKHPQKVDELNQSLANFEDVKSCFDTNAKLLEYRELQNCIRIDDEQDLRMMSAFSVAIDPWMSEFSDEIAGLEPKLNKNEKINARLISKASNALADHRGINEDEAIADHFENIELVKEEIINTNAKAISFEQVREVISPNPALNERLDDGLLEEYAENKKRLKIQQSRIEQIEKESKFIKVVENSAGKTCPKMGRNRPKETKIAIKTLRSYFRKVESGRIRIDGPIKTKTIKKTKTQRFSGLVCGLRDSKFNEGDVELCAIHRFEISRRKKRGRWTKWKGVTTEGELKDGIDCARTD